MAKRASLEELKEFANKVRAAGGGNPLDALMPAIPEDSTQCLIAKNLNFNCQVEPANGKYKGLSSSRWVMTVDDKDTRDRIAAALGLAKRNDSYYDHSLEDTVSQYSVVLPKPIGQVADDFDEVWAILHGAICDADDEFHAEFGYYSEGEDFNSVAHQTAFHEMFEKVAAKLDPRDRGIVAELMPYVEESSKEARSLASVITESGKIVR